MQYGAWPRSLRLNSPAVTPSAFAILVVSLGKLQQRRGWSRSSRRRFGGNSFHFSNVNLKHFVKGAVRCGGCHSLIDLEKVSCRFALPLHATLF